MAKTMKAVDIKGGKGPASALFINPDTPIPTPSDSGALVKVHAFGINRSDTLQRQGNYPIPPQAPKTMGLEFSGTIISFGKHPERGFNIGDEVFGLTYGGAYAEYVAVSTHMLIHKPKELNWEEAAGVPEVWMTATQALYLIGDYAPGKSVLWHAGASGVGLAGIQLSKADGASAVYATAGSDEKVKFCQSIGATKGFNYKSSDWSKSVLEETEGKGVDVIIDFVGGTYFQKNIKAAARDSRIVLLGTLGGINARDVNIGPMLGKRLRIEGSTLRSRDEAYQGRLRDQVVAHALPKLTSGEFKVVIDKIFKMSEIQEAHELMESNQTTGKLICVVD